MWLYVSSCPKLFFSDDFIQAQQQLARWADEIDVVSVVVVDPESHAQKKNLSAVAPSPAVMGQGIIYPNISPMGNGLGAIASRTDYYPSPPSTSTETESSGSVM